MTELNIFRYQPFVAVSGNPGVKIPVVDDVSSRGRRRSDGGMGDPPCIKIGFSSRLVPGPRRVSRPCIKIGYVSVMY